MPSENVVSTAELLTDPQSIACPGLTSRRSSEGSSRVVNWLVALTERAQRYLAQAAEADALAGGVAIERQPGFANDALGGAFRSIEAARSVRAQARAQADWR